MSASVAAGHVLLADSNGNVRYRKAGAAEDLCALTDGTRRRGIGLASDGRTGGVEHDGHVEVWDFGACKTLGKFPLWGSQFRFDVAGNALLVRGGEKGQTFNRWSLSSGRLEASRAVTGFVKVTGGDFGTALTSVVEHPQGPTDYAIESVWDGKVLGNLSIDGNIILTATSAAVVYVQMRGSSGPLLQAVSPAGKTLWTRELELEWLSGALRQILTVSRDATVVVVPSAEGAEVVDIVTGVSLTRIPSPLPLILSLDGRKAYSVAHSGAVTEL